MNKIAGTKRRVILDYVKEFLAAVVVAAFMFVYWMAMLLLFSLLLMNLWHTSIDQILRLAIIFTIASGIIYVTNRIYRSGHKPGKRRGKFR